MRRINRKIYFYKVNLLKNNIAENRMSKSEDFSTDFQKMLSQLETLNFDKEKLEYSIYEKKQNGTYDFVLIEEKDEKHICGKLINTDDSGLTYYEEKGELKPLNKVNLAEVSHFYIDLENELMAFEYNSKCSHASSLANYFCCKSRGMHMVSLVNLQSTETLHRFNRISKISSFEFETSTVLLNSNKASQNNKLFIALGTTAQLANKDNQNDQIITLKIKDIPVRKKDRELGRKPYFSAEQLKEDLSEITSLTEDQKFKLDIVGYSELNEKIRVNYFRDLIIGSIILEKDDTSSSTIYEKIKECYLKTYREYIS